MPSDREQLAQIIKYWAQNHDLGYTISPAGETGDESVNKTSGHLSWLIRETDNNIDLLTLLEHLDLFVKRIRNEKKQAVGCYCANCGDFLPFMELNENEAIMCYSCKNNPYY